MAKVIRLIQLKGGDAAAWTDQNLVLAEREIGLELDTKKFKVGDGSTPWNGLEYWTSQGPQGAVGPEGPAGAIGPQGKSAYQVAQEEGYIGSVTDWLSSLKGADGPAGPKGEPGPAGISGLDALTGIDAGVVGG